MKLKKNHSFFTQVVVVSAIFFITSLLLLSTTVHAAGLLKPKNGDHSSISIKSHQVNVIINNGFARTEVDQVFVNNQDVDLEAVYSFPLPKKASFSELSLWIGGQEIVGEVIEKQEAKKVYENQKSKGNDTALAEKDEFRTFNVSVYPCRANDETRVRLVYYQPLSVDLNVGRYVYPLEEGGVDDERIAFWSVDSTVNESFNFNLTLKSAFPIKDLRLPGYQQHAIVEKTRQDQEEAADSGETYKVSLDFPEGDNLSEDIVFYYRLDDNVPARVELIPYKESLEGNGHFIMAITPGASLERINEGVDWTFVLDQSGSMSGGKIQTLANGVAKVIGKMTPIDRYRIITFNSRAHDLTNGFVNATPENVQHTIQQVQNIQANGSTDLHAGLKKAMGKNDSERTTSIILVTDGVANVGATQHNVFVELLRQKDVRLFSFIIGNSANTPLLEKLAKESGGFAMVVSNKDDIYGRIIQAKSKLLHEALHDVKVSFRGKGIKNVFPSKIGSIYKGQQVIIFGQYEQPGEIDITLTAKISGEDRQWSITTTLPEIATGNPELERLWALAAIDEAMGEIRLSGETKRLKQEVISFGTQYSLVTDYTSMIVLNEEEMENIGIQRNNANRIGRERAAQQKRANAPIKSYRVDNSDTGGMFKGAPAPGVGSGPVGPLFLLLLLFCRRIRKNLG